MKEEIVKTIRVSEIFVGIHGENLLAGTPAIFIRVAPGNLKFSSPIPKLGDWKGSVMKIDEVLKKVVAYQLRDIAILGEGSLIQKGTLDLLAELLKHNYRVSLESSGAYSFRDVPIGVIKIVDIWEKERDQLAWENFSLLHKQDQLRFWITSFSDLQWAKQLCAQYKLYENCHVIFVPEPGHISPADLAAWLEEKAEPLSEKTAEVRV